MAKRENLKEILEKQIEENFTSLPQRDALRYYLGFMDGKRYKHTDIVKMTGVNRSTTYAIPDKLFSTLKIGENRKKVNKYFSILKNKLARLFYLSNDEEIYQLIVEDKKLSSFLDGISVMLVGEVLQKVDGLPHIFDVRKKMDKKRKFHSELSPNWIWSYLPEKLVRMTVVFTKNLLDEFRSPISLKEFKNYLKKMDFFQAEKQNISYYLRNELILDEEDLVEFLQESLSRLPYLLPDFVVLKDKIFLKNWIKYNNKGKRVVSPGAKLYLFNYTFRKIGKWVVLDELIREVNKEFKDYLSQEVTKKDFQRRENNKKYFVRKKNRAGKASREWGLRDWEIYGTKLKSINRKLKKIQQNVKDFFSEDKSKQSRWKTKPEVDKYIDEILKAIKSPRWKIPPQILSQYQQIFKGKSPSEMKNLVQWKNLAYNILRVSGEKMNLKEITEIAIYLKAHFDKKWKKTGKTPHITILGELTYRDKDGKFVDYGDWVFGLKDKSKILKEEISREEVYCPTCGKKMATEWKLCPYDGTPLDKK